MSDNDQNLKTLLTEFLEQFFELFFPEWAAKFDFSSQEWLQQELYPDPPDGQRRAVDLLCKLRTREPLLFGGGSGDQWLTLLHVEIEGRDSVEQTGRRTLRYYMALRDRHELPVLPIVVFLHVGLDGVGISTYKEDYGFLPQPESSSSLDVLRFRYLYVGLRALDAVEYLQRGVDLGVALSSLMRIPPDRRVWFKAEALQHIASSGVTDRLRELLARFIEIYVSLEPEEELEFDRLLAEEPYEEVREMGTTYFERGLEKGLERGIEQGIEKGIEKGIERGECRILTGLIERRFGPLTTGQKQQIAAFSNTQREELAYQILAAESLQDLGLAETPRDHPE